MDLLDYNSFIRKQFKDKKNIEISDFIDVSDQVQGTIHVPWEIYSFEKTNFYSASTLLTSIKYHVVSLQQKAIKND